VNDFGPGLSAYRPRRAAGPWGWAAGGNRNSFQRLDGSPSRYHFMS
jgi:hypothetical protein